LIIGNSVIKRINNRILINILILLNALSFLDLPCATHLTFWPSPWIPQYKSFQYGEVSNLILVRLNITHAIYVLNFLHVERWYIFEVVNHNYNVIFKYYMLFSYQTGYIMWHSRLMIFIPWGAHYIPCLIAE
jgi:hypothetical protein